MARPNDGEFLLARWVPSSWLWISYFQNCRAAAQCDKENSWSHLSAYTSHPRVTSRYRCITSACLVPPDPDKYLRDLAAICSFLPESAGPQSLSAEREPHVSFATFSMGQRTTRGREASVV